MLYLASRVQGASPHFGPQPSAFLRGLAQHDPNGKRSYIQLVCRSYLSRMMVFHWLLLALLGSYLAAWQVGCTELSYFYSTRVVASITWTLLEKEFLITWFCSSRPKPNQEHALFVVRWLKPPRAPISPLFDGVPLLAGLLAFFFTRASYSNALLARY